VNKCVQKGRSDTIQLMKENQVLMKENQTLLMKNVGDVTAHATRANSASSDIHVVADRETHVSSTHGAGDALSDSALAAYDEADAAAQTSNTFFAAPCGASAVSISTNSFGASMIGKVVSEASDSLNLSASVAKSAGEVECEAFLKTRR
jgi:hypothetical protein